MCQFLTCCYYMHQTMRRLRLCNKLLDFSSTNPSHFIKTTMLLAEFVSNTAASPDEGGPHSALNKPIQKILASFNSQFWFYASLLQHLAAKKPDNFLSGAGGDQTGAKRRVKYWTFITWTQTPLQWEIMLLSVCWMWMQHICHVGWSKYMLNISCYSCKLTSNSLQDSSFADLIHTCHLSR